MPAKKLYCAFYGLDTMMKQYLRPRMRGHKVSLSSELLSEDNIDRNTEVLGVFVESPVTKKMMEKMPKLKLIVTLSTGFDHVDLSAARKRNIPVCNVPFYGENTVAEHAVALTLALTRKLFTAVKRVKEGEYDYHGLRGTDLKGKTIGVVGTGSIGKHYLQMMKGFETTLIAYDAFPKKELATELGFSYVSLNKLLEQSDIVSLHVPLFPETYHMINKRNIKKMKKGAFLINTARGGLVDPEAILWGLDNKHLAGAGLDVLEEEGVMKKPKKLIYSEGKDSAIRTSLMNNLLIDHERTIITPHNAFNTVEALKRILDTTVENVKAYLGGAVQNDVTKRKKK